MENFETSYACSPSLLSTLGAHSTGTASTWPAYGLGRTRGVIALAPLSVPTQGTGVSVAAMRDTATDPATARKTALLPISDVVVINGFDGRSGIRSWKPPV